MKRAALAAASLSALFATQACAAPAAADVPGLRFDRVFETRGEPPTLHFRAAYTARGVPHTLEVWRDGDRRLVRRTDEAVATHVARRPGEAGYQMVVLDLRRKIETRVTRDDLYRIGNFTDWFDLAHGLRYPKGAYRLTAVPAAETPALKTAVPCRWYRLAQGPAATRLCWSTQERLLVALLGEGETPLWQVESVSRAAPPAEVFEVRDRGYVRNDASRDISGD